MKSNFRKAFEAAAKQDADNLIARGYTVTFVTEEEFEDGVGVVVGWNCVIQKPGNKYPVWNSVSREVNDLGIKTPIGHWQDLIELGEYTTGMKPCSVCGKPATFEKLSDAGNYLVCDDHKE